MMVIKPNTYKNLLILLCVVVFGIFVSVKYLSPPCDDISIGKIKLRGTGHTIENVIEEAKSNDESKYRDDEKVIKNRKNRKNRKKVRKKSL